MKTEQKIELQANRLLGEFIGTVAAILHWEIPDELRVKLQAQLEELSKVKIISSNGDVSGNEANQPENKKYGEVVVAFADWLAGKYYKTMNGRWALNGDHDNDKFCSWTTEELYEKFKTQTAKATDR